MIKKQDLQPIQHIWQEQMQQNQENLTFARALWQNGRLLYDRFQNNYRHLLALPRKSQRIIQRKIAPSLAAAALVLAIGTATIQTSQASPTAAIIIVDGITCTLADAITAANTDAAVNGCTTGNGADTLDLQVNVNLINALPNIISEITLNGNSHVIDGQGNPIAILSIHSPGNLTINEATITGGYGFVNGGGIINATDGIVTINNVTISNNKRSGIINSGQMSINNSTITGNESLFRGGGVSNGGTLVVSNSTFSGNSAEYYGGGISNYEGNVTISQSTISGNSAGSSGGGLFNYSYSNDAIINLSQSIISGNTSANAPEISQSGGAGYSPEIAINGNDYNLIGHNNNSGVVLYSGTNNTGGGGDVIAPSQLIWNILQTSRSGSPILANHGGTTDTILLVPSSIAINAIPNGSCYTLADQRGVTRPIGGNCDIGAVEADFGDQCTLSDAIIAANTDAIAGNCPAGDGHDTIELNGDELLLVALPTITSPITINGNGHTVDGDNKFRIFSITSGGELTVNDAVLQNGRAWHPVAAANGGAIVNNGTFTLNNSTIKDSVAPGVGGAIFNFQTVIINSSTLSNNDAGIFGGAISNENTLTMTNSTISGNTAPFGGGIANVDGTVTLIRSTVTGNSATHNDGNGGGIENTSYYYSPTLNLEQSIVSGNSAANGAEIFQNGGNYAGLTTLNANNHNLIGHSGDSGVAVSANNAVLNMGSNGDIISPTQTLEQILTVNISDEPLLADNGGPTETVALPPNSPAIDAGDPTYPELPDEYDQRGVGYPRVLNGRLDIGAYERDVRTINVNVDGNGSVSSDPAGISCESDCSETYDFGTVVTLTAVISPNSTFTGWTGAIITTTNPLVLTMDEARDVTATFNTTQFYIFLPVILK